MFRIETMQELAKRLITGTYSPAAKPATITRTLDFNYLAQSATVQTQTVNMIPQAISLSRISGDAIQLGDFSLIGYAPEFAWVPDAERCELTFKGKEHVIVSVTEDAADAAIRLHVRAK